MSGAESGERWDFYPCVVEDRPASVYLDLNLAEEHPPLESLYFAAIEILDPDTHGMGSQADAEQLWPLEDALLKAFRALGLCFVGRLRNNSAWQLTLYGKTGLDADLERVVSQALEGEKRRFQIGSQPDPEWSYYHGFLYPDDERWQWMQNRKVVEALAKKGDSGSRLREVDHWAFFETEASCRAFVASAEGHGFSVRVPPSEQGGQFFVKMGREDTVELEHIHQVNMQLHDLAEEHGGTYDGWESPVVSA